MKMLKLTRLISYNSATINLFFVIDCRVLLKYVCFVELLSFIYRVLLHSSDGGNHRVR